MDKKFDEINNLKIMIFAKIIIMSVLLFFSIFIYISENIDIFLFLLLFTNIAADFTIYNIIKLTML